VPRARSERQARKSLLRATVRKLGGLGSVVLLTVTCDFLSLIAVYTLRLSIVGSVKLADLIVGLTIPTVLVPMTSAFYILLIRDLDKAESDLDEALQIAAKAQVVARTAAVGTMAAGIAHEINNPLAIIRSRAELANTLYAKGLLTQEKFATFHESIVRGCGRISYIISGMRTMALVDSIEEKANLVELVGQTSQFFRGRAALQSTNLTIENTLNEIQATDVFVNGAHLMQALTSLIGNAFDAVEGQSNSWVKIRIENSGQFAKVSVVNSGPLIAESVRRRLMEPFFSTKPIGKGIGLGLSMSRSMIEGMKGELFLDESPSHTCLVVHIPWHDAASIAA